jgi:fucose 4-O-acetylase-like acetyltransferase
MRKQRITYFDIAKGIGIISIILGHLNVNTFNRIVFTYHVPLFFIISGYFISDKDDLSLFIRKRARGLLLPYLYTGLLCIIASLFYDYAYHQLSIKSVLDTIRAVIYGSGSGYNKTLLGIKPIGAIWFLLALFWSSIMVKVIKNSRFELPVVIAVFIVSVLSKEIVWLPFSLQSAGTALLFVYIGNVLKRKKIDFQKPNIWIIVSGMVFLMVEAYFKMTISFASNQFAYWYITILGAVLISYIMAELSIRAPPVTESEILYA